MRNIFILVLILSMMIGCQSEEVFHGDVDGVSYGVDGLSFNVKNGDTEKKVRLALVQLPKDEVLEREMGRKAFNSYKGHTVTATIIDSAKEKYLSAPAFLTLDDQDIAIPLIEEGYLRVDEDSKYAEKYPEKVKAYLDAQEVAQKNELGIWGADEN
ncbi:thermonuclease family protein [Desmospora activa]|uniref:Endonuclease YncB(Thermonuclease family) n=1 Tax=Desmospora activa DSM 45169 TaxID=1121389 RepID=A0A2T4Z6Q5_9BACL|nr:thermonuclease family protein [Desmospora activa]PTM57575.1 endonuclease YncB(thermonuclease family) [Desmospora activa DSM 45169]